MKIFITQCRNASCDRGSIANLVIYLLSSAMAQLASQFIN